MSDAVSQDFVFGTLATDALRLAQIRATRSGITHHHHLEPADPQPDQPVKVFVELGPHSVASNVTCYYTTDDSEPDGTHGVALVGDAVAFERRAVTWDTLLWGYVEHWVATLPAQPQNTLVRYRIEAWSEQSLSSQWANEIIGVASGTPPPDLEPYDQEVFALPGQQPLWPIRRIGSYAYHVDQASVPLWLRDAVIYHVFIDRFHPGEGKSFAEPSTLGGLYGGTVRGVIEQLDYIVALGATCLWLSPLFPSPSHHGYDATDYGSVEPRLGTLEDVQNLIDAAHARGLRVLFDYVVNHISAQHPVFQQAQQTHDAPEAAWFSFTEWPHKYVSFFGVADLPQINSDAPAARDYMIEHAVYWLQQGVDGFRLDYANGPSHAFWSVFRAATRAAAPASITLGEVVETAALQRSYQGRLDGCLDFLLLQTLRQFFAFNSITPSTFDAILQRHLAFFPLDFVLPSFLDNHDMNRFLWVVGGDVQRLKLAAVCQCTLPYPPIIYYGTEVGLSQQRDVRYADGSGHPEESRLPMLWGANQNQELLDFYRQLIALRRSMPALWRGSRRTLCTDDASGLYVYACSDRLQQAIVVLNNGDATQSWTLPNQAYLLTLTSHSAATYEHAIITLPAWSGAVLTQS